MIVRTILISDRKQEQCLADVKETTHKYEELISGVIISCQAKAVLNLIKERNKSYAFVFQSLFTKANNKPRDRKATRTYTTDVNAYLHRVKWKQCPFHKFVTPLSPEICCIDTNELS